MHSAYMHWKISKNPAKNNSYNKLFISLPTATEISHLYLFHDNNKHRLKPRVGGQLSTCREAEMMNVVSEIISSF